MAILEYKGCIKGTIRSHRGLIIAHVAKAVVVELTNLK
jgi:hypothetical protein